MSKQEQIERILGAWLERCEAGHVVDPEEVVRSHPDLADELRRRFAAFDVMHRLFSKGKPGAASAPRQIGEYRILREIGRGGMGIVYEAEQTPMRRKVALKVLYPTITSTPKAVKRFQREARAAGRLHHTNIVPVHAMGQEGALSYYSMELVAGRTLDQIIRELERLGARPREAHLAALSGAERLARPSDSAPATAGATTGDHAYFARLAEMFAEVADALQEAHDQEIVHRDIKPSNLILADDGRLKVMDFGLARVGDESRGMTMTGDLVGTPVYMSPEQAAGRRGEVDHRTDIYSLGATIYEVLTLQPPFGGRTLQQVYAQILDKDPALPRRANRRIPKDLETIVAKAMEKEPRRRYATARALADDLRLFAAGHAIQARPIGVCGRLWRRIKRHKVRSGLAATVVVLGAAGSILAVVAVREARLAVREGRLRRALDYAMLLARAEEMMAQGRGNDDLAAAISRDPSRPEGYFGRALGSNRTFAERLEDLAAARARGLSERTFHLAQAEVFRLMQRHEEADAEEKMAAAFQLEGAKDVFLEGLFFAAQGEARQAIPLFTAAVEDPEAPPSVRYLARHARAGAREHEGDLEGALTDLAAVRGFGDDSLEVRVRIALLWRRLGHEARAADLFEAMLAEARGDGTEQAWRNLGRACQIEVAWRDRVCAEALEAFPDCGHFLIVRARCADLSPTERIALADRAVALDPNHADFAYLRGLVLWELGQYRKALDDVNRSLRLDPNQALVHSNRACVLQDLGQHDDALIAVDRALELNPHDAKAHSNRGTILDELGSREEALEAYDRALKLDPCLTWAHYNRGNTYKALGQLEKALADYERAIELDARNAGAHNNRGTVLEVQGKLQDALDAYDASLAIDPERPETHLNRAIALMRMNKHTDALKGFNEAARLKPDYLKAHIGRGMTLNTLGNYEEAVKAWDDVLALDPNHAGAHGDKGRALFELEKYEESFEAHERGIELGLRNHEMINWLAWHLATWPDPALRKPARAAELAQKALDLAPGTGAYLNTLGVALCRAGQWQEAITALERSMAAREGGDANDWFFLAIARHNLGEEAPARLWYDKAAAWMQEHRPEDAELKRFRAEAAQVLGMDSNPTR
ncbi:MAG: tetratricopeptide repeat protein [Planctomycetota bacterium]|jgi:serine/threonine protein kinase/tetratricopeptide (TPR) repeat protein